MTAMSLGEKVAELQKRIVSMQSEIDSLKEERNYTFKDLGLTSKGSSFEDLGLKSKGSLFEDLGLKSKGSLFEDLGLKSRWRPFINMHNEDEHYDLGIEILSILDQCDILERDKMNLIEFMNDAENKEGLIQTLKGLEDVLFESDSVLDELNDKLEKVHASCDCRERK